MYTIKCSNFDDKKICQLRFIALVDRASASRFQFIYKKRVLLFLMCVLNYTPVAGSGRLSPYIG